MTLYEIIEGLIDANDLLLKANERVPVDQRNHKDYLDARRYIHEHLPTKEAIELACYHEAGHYFAAVEVATQLNLDSSNFKVVGPSIRYEPKKWYPYNWTPIGLYAPGLENPKIQDEVDAVLLARISMAGGESVRGFYGSKTKRGDGGDIFKFGEICKTAPQGVLTQEPKTYMVHARRHFRKKLKDVQFRVKVSLKAEETKGALFGPVFHSQM